MRKENKTTKTLLALAVYFLVTIPIGCVFTSEEDLGNACSSKVKVKRTNSPVSTSYKLLVSESDPAFSFKVHVLLKKIETASDLAEDNVRVTLDLTTDDDKKLLAGHWNVGCDGEIFYSLGEGGEVYYCPNTYIVSFEMEFLGECPEGTVAVEHKI